MGASRRGALLLCACLAACSGSKAPSHVTVGIVGPPQSVAVAGAAQRCGLVTGVTVTQSDAGSGADAQRALDAMAVRNVDEIVAVGPLAAHALWVTARAYPRRHFAEIGAVVKQPNVTSVEFRDDEGAYLAGAFAALAAAGKPVAFLGSPGADSVAAQERGFAAGAREGDPRSAVVPGEVEAGGRAAFETALRPARARGAALAYVASGDGGGALYALGQGQPRLVFSVARSDDAAVQRICENAVSQKPVSGVLRLGVAEGAIAVGGSESALAPAERARFDVIRHAFERRRPAQTPAPG